MKKKALLEGLLFLIVWAGLVSLVIWFMLYTEGGSR